MRAPLLFLLPLICVVMEVNVFAHAQEMTLENSISVAPIQSLDQDVKYARQLEIVTEHEWLLLKDDLNVFWLLSMGIIVFLLQLAFPMLEAGSFHSFSSLFFLNPKV
jgi:hypothetical protein